jgi:UPF0755 protein
MIRLLALVVLLALVGLGLVGRELIQPAPAAARSQIVVIEPRMQAPAVARLFVERGILAHRYPFLLRYWLGRGRNTLKAGEYEFDRSLTPLEVYEKLTRGEVYLHAVVIPEGSDRFDLARIFYEQLGVKPEEFLRATEQTREIEDLAPRASSLEGYLFPDTYRFARGATAQTIAGAMVARFRHVLDSGWAKELRQSPQELQHVITLASLVEKETPDPTERPVIAGVFARRLEKHWALQCDPTVVYAVRLKDRPIDHSSGPITRDDLEFDSPYNTYRHVGLPPGPIANPGEASIRAAFHPAPGNVFYFVSNNQGGHIFATTLAEHQRNVARYRRQVAALGRGARGPEQNREMRAR